MPTEHPSHSAAFYVTLSDQELIAQCEVDAYRASGPGGQKRNKTSSAVRLRHKPTGLIAGSVEDRSQHTNKARALRRLRLTIALHVRAKVATDNYKPSAVVREGVTSDGRIVMGRKDHRYPAFVGELLDLLAACELRVSDTAKLLKTTTGKFVSFLKDEPKLWQRVNEMRQECGLSALK